MADGKMSPLLEDTTDERQPERILSEMEGGSSNNNIYQHAPSSCSSSSSLMGAEQQQQEQQEVEEHTGETAAAAAAATAGDDRTQRCMASFQIWCNPEHPTIANELRGMPRERRELVWVDLSGNRKGSMYYQELDPKLQETTENVERALHELDAEIQRLPTFTLLRKVQQQNPDYLDDRSFRMQFLRCERFHAKDALTRMMRYFEEKRKLWGDQCLGREISISDLNEDDLECLREGGHTMLRNLESSGRRIYLTNRGALQHPKTKCLLRANWYLMMKMLQEDESMQTMGVVRLSYLLNYNSTPSAALVDASMGRSQFQMCQSLPIRFAAIYIVSQPGTWDAAINSTLKVLSSAMVVRTRLLTGSYQECKYQLACLGITNLPIKRDGSMNMSEHLAWVQACLDAQGPRKRQKRGDNDMIEDESNSSG